jgi:DNA-binding transcriptional ArsR family regulator
MAAAHEPRLARVATLVADPSRSRMLAYLMGGELASAGELAHAASVTPATASGHLARLLEGRLLVCEPRGRHRYYRLADAEVAHALEALALVAERDDHDRAWAHPERQRLRAARCCYGHLAGRLGIRLFDTLQAHQALAAGPAGYTLTAAGRGWLQGLGLEASAASPRRRYAYACLDWSERRDHLAGQLADEILGHCLARGWLARGPGRAITVTPCGEREFLPQLTAPADTPRSPEPDPVRP